MPTTTAGPAVTAPTVAELQTSLQQLVTGIDEGTREDGDKVVAQYIDGQQEALLAAVQEQRDSWE